ncbi:uncharacterized protein DUF3649 [Paraburkholderia silvatlantica]|uniref:Uncharacterized protein DUF3649 n=1 Tax=Paraburkholderia silvatlantica TaxID=321895 RepID=A0A2V4TQW8_9BURK|nr:DUF3649 domain-containing protein [Paraburkholderia silvatlantica]PYE19839.1 uncharacterized protein DUF3649 [Paraburkholderia silvatlantica]
MALPRPSVQSPVRSKRDVVSRVCAAIFGGYVVATALSVLLARLLPLSKASAVTAAIMVTPVLYLAAMLWAFAARSPSRAWVGQGIVTLVAGLLAAGLIAWGGR